MNADKIVSEFKEKKLRSTMHGSLDYGEKYLGYARDAVRNKDFLDASRWANRAKRSMGDAHKAARAVYEIERRKSKTGSEGDPNEAEV